MEQSSQEVHGYRGWLSDSRCTVTVVVVANVEDDNSYSFAISPCLNVKATHVLRPLDAIQKALSSTHHMSRRPKLWPGAFDPSSTLYPFV